MNKSIFLHSKKLTTFTAAPLKQR